MEFGGGIFGRVIGVNVLDSGGEGRITAVICGTLVYNLPGDRGRSA